MKTSSKKAESSKKVTIVSHEQFEQIKASIHKKHNFAINAKGEVQTAEQIEKAKTKQKAQIT